MYNLSMEKKKSKVGPKSPVDEYKKKREVEKKKESHAKKQAENIVSTKQVEPKAENKKEDNPFGLDLPKTLSEASKPQVVEAPQAYINGMPLNPNQPAPFTGYPYTGHRRKPLVRAIENNKNLLISLIVMWAICIAYLTIEAVYFSKWASMLDDFITFLGGNMYFPDHLIPWWSTISAACIFVPFLTWITVNTLKKKTSKMTYIVVLVIFGMGFLGQIFNIISVTNPGNWLIGGVYQTKVELWKSQSEIYKDVSTLVYVATALSGIGVLATAAGLMLSIKAK